MVEYPKGCFFLFCKFGIITNKYNNVPREKMMKINKFALIWSCCIILSGCTTTLTQTDETSSQEESKVIKSEPAESGTIQNLKEEKVNQNENKIEVIRGHLIDEQIGITHARLIDEQIASSIGESKSYFDNKGDSKVKIYILNTGTESFQFSIRNVNDTKKIVTGVLNTNETYEVIINDLPEGSYIISYVVVEENPPADIALSVKVDLVG